METAATLIIPIYNVEPYIDQCIGSVVRSVESAGTDAVEALLIDDGSTDRSGKIADRYAANYPYIRVFHQKNAGVAAARNAGLRRASGRWLYFMDADDWLAEDGIAHILAAAEEYGQADMILFDAFLDVRGRELPWEHFAEETVWNTREQIGRMQRGILYYPMAHPGTKIPLAAPWDKLYRRDFLNQNGLEFREGLKVLDDMVFNMEAVGKAWLIPYVKRKIYHYRKVEGSITNAYREDRVERDRDVWDYLREYGERQESAWGWSDAEAAAFRQAFYCRVIRSFAICCRLNFYHRENPRSHRQRQAYVREVLHSRPYAEAFDRVYLRHAEWKLKIVILLVRCGLYRGLYLLCLTERMRNRIQGRRKSLGWRLRSRESLRRE